MYDTEKRIELVKKRMHEYHRRQERRTICRLSVLYTLLFLSLVGAMEIMQSRPINATGMYGTILSCMRAQATMCWWLSFSLLWQS
ncbi:MAG: hypothetical protein ACLSGK_06645 [Lachnospiraceae bacterium]